ncbi:family 20 glycosylhydrolase [bacterium]|nr:family 20 glycosylhydrolase [bacterium]
MHRKMALILILMFGFIMFFMCSENRSGNSLLSIVPVPKSIKILSGKFIISDKFKIMSESDDPGVKYVSDFLENYISRARSAKVPVMGSEEEKENTLILRINKQEEKSLGAEGYELKITPGKIIIRANKPAGLFYGVQTILQLLPAEIWSLNTSKKIGTMELPCIIIKDAPRYKYRGMHLDVGRHFFPVSFIKRYIDYIAMHKMNVFHWHLTEDQGWRIEIKKYPKLTSVGAWRKETMIGRLSDRPYRYDHKRYGGFYTQDQIREIVKYAKERFITVIPEIEMPGHSVAALAAYPEFSCTGGPFEVKTRWGVSKDIYCAGKDETFRFLEDILTEVMDLFPSKYIHIGGDEAPKDRWKKCPDCQKRINEEGLKNEHELQSYFITRIEKFLNKHGRKIIGWDEILEGGLAPNAAVMSWRGISGGIAAARTGHDVIMTPTEYCYFDYYQAPRSMEPTAIGGLTTLKKVYSFNPVPEDSLIVDQRKYVIGGQGNVWTEFIGTPEYAEYMFFPRMCALAEVLWTPKDKRDWNGFKKRMDKQYKRLYEMGADFRIPCPVIDRAVVVNKGEPVKIGNPLSIGEVRYTIGSKDPDISDSLYTHPLVFNTHAIIKSRVFLPDGRAGSVVTTTVLIKDLAPKGMRFGLNYKYFEEDFSDTLPDFSSFKPVSKGHASILDLDVLPRRESQFGVIFTGYINISRDGKYRFWLYADDGVEIYIDNKRVAGNKSYTGSQSAGKIFLTKGYHTVRILHFELWGNQALELWYSGPGIEKQQVPPRMFLCDK